LQGKHIRALSMAKIYLGLEDKERAFAWLQDAVEQRDLTLYLTADPIYDPLRADSRFANLLRRMNLKP